MAATTKPPSKPLSIPLPLAPRIDRLDSIMKILEEEKCIPIDMAVREAELKGSLMDRVRSLENRVLKASNIRVVSFEAGKAFAGDIGVPFLETSAKNTTNVEDAFMAMSAEIKKRVAIQSTTNSARPT